jgi:hypothetical protein
MSVAEEVDERQELAVAIARNPDLFDVVSRHGLTEDDLLLALRSLRQRGFSGRDLWTLVSHAARQAGRSASDVRP